MATTQQQKPDKKREIRKRHAVDALQSAQKKGVLLQDQNALPTILQEYIEACDLPQTWFEVLRPEDWWDLFTKFANPVKNAGSLNSLTPPASQAGIDEKSEGAKRPTYEEHDGPQPFPVTIHLPDKNFFRAVTACCCNERESFISEKVISQNGLHSLVADDNTIRLSWKNCSQPMAKTPCTKFWILSDDQIKNDIAIGNGYCEEEEEEDNSGVYSHPSCC
ncbi:hypothetical protein K469DRAFT_16666 [Zopfia rhizophila CBS 207.26]|uniref:Uncharacterized protein n=1 Tax=Zopfia rhizophila CBS 207.26 TaxID=1314779 RepID=A0A6A6EWQ1_9PEZI|nr:hypothetical protein K469DRAFT_16666 [Zopfia rhizophila CBS 207.26]